MTEGILSAIGKTPLVRLERVSKDLPFQLYAKLEFLNPGGSMKDRPALNIIKHGMLTGEINQDTIIIESSSGNMGVGLAQACSYYGLRFICVVDPKTTPQNILLLNAYGCTVDYVSEPDPETGEYLQARIKRVQELLRQTKNSFWPNQYSNLQNAAAHQPTMREIVAELGDEVDYLFCATSTCGTLRGCSLYVQEQKHRTKIFAVDALGSVIFGGQQAKRLIPGHGAAIRPDLYQPDLAERCLQVTDLECVVGCRRLVRREAILGGGSTGAVLMAIESMKNEIPRGRNCVAIFPDRGERYLNTIYSDHWVNEHFGNISHLWEDHLELQPCATTTF
jgi:cysteine synthase A